MMWGDQTRMAYSAKRLRWHQVAALGRIATIGGGMGVAYLDGVELRQFIGKGVWVGMGKVTDSGEPRKTTVVRCW